eukprot:SM000026S08934  [mRNA]  locus=s26:488889:491185:- [translate_table: standard]
MAVSSATKTPLFVYLKSWLSVREIAGAAPPLLELVDLLAQRLPMQQAPSDAALLNVLLTRRLQAANSARPPAKLHFVHRLAFHVDVAGEGGVDDRNAIFLLESGVEAELDCATENDGLGPGLPGPFNRLPHPLLRLIRVHLEFVDMQAELLKGDDSLPISVFANGFFHLDLPFLDADDDRETVANAGDCDERGLARGADDHTSANLSRLLEGGVIEAGDGASVKVVLAGVVRQVKDGLSDGSFTGAELEVGDVLPGQVKRDNVHLHMRGLHSGNHVGEGLVVHGRGDRVDP